MTNMLKLMALVSAGILTLACESQSASITSAGETAPVQALIERLLPGHGGDFVVETISAAVATENVFEIATKDGKIVLRGDGPLSQCVALNYYLTHAARVSVSLYAEVPILVPVKLPLPEQPVRKRGTSA